MYHTIKTRDGRSFVFSMPTRGGYVSVEINRPAGVSAGRLRQICYGGKFRGTTIIATPETFKRVCRSWYRSFRKAEE